MTVAWFYDNRPRPMNRLSVVHMIVVDRCDHTGVRNGTGLTAVVLLRVGVGIVSASSDGTAKV